MGCDIHMFTEQRVDGAWVLTGEGPYEDRNYDLFWLLGGIRRRPGEIPPVAPARGIPDDASEAVAHEHEQWSLDAHSASWLLLSELREFLAANPTAPEQDGSSFWTEGLTALSRCAVHDDCKESDALARACAEGRPHDVRIVFWFDN